MYVTGRITVRQLWEEGKIPLFLPETKRREERIFTTFDWITENLCKYLYPYKAGQIGELKTS
jgi:hypothetical protein